jgi:YVTN family beta-propeller protein
MKLRTSSAAAGRRRAVRLALAGLAAIAMATVAQVGPFAAAAQAAATVVTPVSAGAPPGLGGPVAVNNGPADQLDGHISGTLVSYTDFSPSLPGIRYHSLSTGADTAVPSNDGSTDVVSAVSGTRIVYTHFLAGTEAIYYFDTASPGQAPTELDPLAGSIRTDASIEGNTVAWEDYDFNPSEPQIVAYDLATSTATPITGNSLTNINPSVSPSGTVIAWTGCASPNTDCAIYDSTLSGGTWSAPQQLTDPTAKDCELPRTDGVTVVYDCVQGGAQSIYWQPVGGGPESQLSVPGNSRDARISGGLISFDNINDPSGNDAIDVYSTATNTLYKITNDESVSDILPDISVGTDGIARLIWTVQEPTNGDNLYAVSFPAPALELYVANAGSGTVTPVTAATGMAGTPIRVGTAPDALAVSADGSMLYVANGGSGTITPVATATGTAGTAIRVGTVPDALAVSSDGSTLYVANGGSGTITPVATATGTAGTAIRVGTVPDALAVSADGKTLYVANGGSGTITPVATATNTAGTAIRVGTVPDALAVSADGKTLYVANGGSGTITPVATATNTAGPPIRVGTAPDALALSPDGSTLYVANGGSGTVTPVTTVTGTAGSPIRVGTLPRGEAIAP